MYLYLSIYLSFFLSFFLSRFALFHLSIYSSITYIDINRYTYTIHTFPAAEMYVLYM